MNFARSLARLCIGAAVLIVAAFPLIGSASAELSNSQLGPQDSGSCVQYLERNNYPVDGPRLHACQVGAGGGAFAFPACWGQLVNTGVDGTIAGNACTLAAN